MISFAILEARLAIEANETAYKMERRKDTTYKPRPTLRSDIRAR